MALRFRVLLIVTIAAAWTSPAFAVGETFKLNTSGKETCGHFQTHSFKPANDVDLWARIDSETEITVSLTPDFQPGWTFVLHGQSYRAGQNGAKFVGGAAFMNGGWVTVEGTATLGGSGQVKKLKGTFVQWNLFDDDCFSSGKFSTTPVVTQSGSQGSGGSVGLVITIDMPPGLPPGTLEGK